MNKVVTRTVHRSSVLLRNVKVQLVVLPSLLFILFVLKRNDVIQEKRAEDLTALPQRCLDDFHVSVRHARNTPHVPQSTWPCFAEPPSNYTPILPEPARLWRVPRSNIGTLDTTDPEYKLHVTLQRWAHIGEEFVDIRSQGGTSGRAFEDNFDYVREVVRNVLDGDDTCMSQVSDPGIMLDMGAGIGSVAAALRDERGGNRSLKALSYVWPDEYMRNQVIISNRGLPAFLANFTGSLPFPSSSFDVVHCKWCWHHVVGYDVWIKEVDRLLVPGGMFIFTFASLKDNIIDHEKFGDVLERFNFSCTRSRRIILFCRKKYEDEGNRRTANKACARKKVQTPTKRLLREVERTVQPVLRSLTKKYKEVPPRWISLNCNDAKICRTLEGAMPVNDMIHVSGWSDQAVSKALLDSRQFSIIHDWAWNLPFYPRSFDGVMIGCTPSTRAKMEQVEFWMEVNRILSPSGVVVISKLLCQMKTTTLLKVIASAKLSVLQRIGNTAIIVKNDFV